MECEGLLPCYKDSATGSYCELQATSWQPTVLRTALYWVNTQQIAVISYQRFGRGPDRLNRNVGQKLPLFAA